MMFELFQYLNNFFPIDPATQVDLSRILKKRELRKHYMWLKEGEVCNKIAFIEKGLVKIYFECGNKEIVIWYNKENDVMLSVKSFIERVPSLLAIKTLEPTTVYYIDYKELMDVYERHTPFNINARKILEKYYSISEEHVMMMALPERQRYERLWQLQPWMFESNRIKEKMLAAYIGVTPETFSNYRNGR